MKNLPGLPLMEKMEIAWDLLEVSFLKCVSGVSYYFKIASTLLLWYDTEYVELLSLDM